MLGKDVQVRLRQRIKSERHIADYRQAAGLLRHDLVWSHDFDAIRLPLADLIDFHADADYQPSALTDIVQQLISTENDLTI